MVNYLILKKLSIHIHLYVNINIILKNLIKSIIKVMKFNKNNENKGKTQAKA